MKRITTRLVFIGLTLSLLYTSVNLSAQNLSEDFNTWTKKGRDFMGLNFSVQHEQGTNVQKLLTLDTELYTLDWAVRLYGGHFINNNITLGALFEWNQSNGNREYVLDGENIAQNYFRRGFLVGPTLRTYLPLSKNNRIGIFNEVNLLFGFSKAVDQKDNEKEISRAISQAYSFSLGLVPGINFFVSDGWAFEVSIPLLGLETMVREGTIDGVESRQVSNNVNFSINLLSLKLGVTKYF